jgi:DNA-binding MarR family transcriptional regulator
LDLVAVGVDFLSVVVLIVLVFVALKAARAFKDSRQALSESASVLEIIVSSLSSRVVASESVVSDLRREVGAVMRQGVGLEGKQSDLRASYLQVLQYLQELLSNDKRLILELEQLKTRLTTVQQTQQASEPNVGERRGLSSLNENALASLTPTERLIVEILAKEGPKAAPDLGRRVKKSREHMSRLMKKLYMEGYVDRESNHAPFRYRLNEKIRTLLEPPNSVTAEASEKA